MYNPPIKIQYLSDMFPTYLPDGIVRNIYSWIPYIATQGMAVALGKD